MEEKRGGYLMKDKKSPCVLPPLLDWEMQKMGGWKKILHVLFGKTYWQLRSDFYVTTMSKFPTRMLKTNTNCQSFMKFVYSVCICKRIKVNPNQKGTGNTFWDLGTLLSIATNQGVDFVAFLLPSSGLTLQLVFKLILNISWPAMRHKSQNRADDEERYE